MTALTKPQPQTRKVTLSDFRSLGLVPCFTETVYINLENGKIEQAFPQGMPIVIVDPHGDDAAIHAQCTIRSLIRMNRSVSLVTIVHDYLGVEDDFAEEWAGGRFLDLQVVKRKIRQLENIKFAQAMRLGSGSNYYDMDLDFPLKEGTYSKEGKFLSYESEFEATTEDIEAIDRFVKLQETSIFLLNSPWSKHSQHRISTDLFLQAIKKYLPNSFVYFWTSKRENEECHQIEDNLVVYSSVNDRIASSYLIDKYFVSQNSRHNPRFYSEMSEDLGKYVFNKHPIPNGSGFAEAFKCFRFADA